MFTKVDIFTHIMTPKYTEKYIKMYTIKYKNINKKDTKKYCL